MEMEIWPAYISKINSDFERQIILLMITNGEKEDWNYPAVKKSIFTIERNNFKK